IGFVSRCFVGRRSYNVSSFDNARRVTPLQGLGMCVLFTVGQAPRLGLGHPPRRANAGLLFRDVIMQLERRRSDSWWWVLFRDVSLVIDRTTFRHLTTRAV